MSTVIKIGNSHGVRLKKDILEKIGLKVNDKINIDIDGMKEKPVIVVDDLPAKPNITTDDNAIMLDVVVDSAKVVAV